MWKSKGFISAVLVITVGLLVGMLAQGQSIFATLTGEVADGSGARVPGASITLTNTASRDVRKTVANQDGYYAFTSVPTGAYDLLIEAKGFQTFKETGISFTGAEKRNVNAVLQIG